MINIEEQIERYMRAVKRRGGVEAYMSAGQRETIQEVAASLVAAEKLPKCIQTTLMALEKLVLIDRLAFDGKWVECKRLFVELAMLMGEIKVTCDIDIFRQYGLLMELFKAIEEEDRDMVSDLIPQREFALKWGLLIVVAL